VSKRVYTAPTEIQIEENYSLLIKKKKKKRNTEKERNHKIFV